MANVELVEPGAIRIAGFRSQVPIDELPQAFAEHLPAAWRALSEAGVAELGPPSSIYHAMDGTVCDLTIGIEIAEGVEAPEGLDVAEVPQGTEAKLDFYGPFDRIREGFAELAEWCQANGRTPSNRARERYITDPEQEPDSSKWLTELYLGVE